MSQYRSEIAGTLALVPTPVKIRIDEPELEVSPTGQGTFWIPKSLPQASDFNCFSEQSIYAILPLLSATPQTPHVQVGFEPAVRVDGKKSPVECMRVFLKKVTISYRGNGLPGRG